MSKILIIEDDKDVVSVLKMALEKEGYEVDYAYDGLEALEKIKEKPDAIILDLMLPKVDGYSINIKLKENPQTKDIPVIVLTGKGYLKELMGIREEMKVQAYLEKPVPMKTILEKIKSCLTKKE